MRIANTGLPELPSTGATADTTRAEAPASTAPSARAPSGSAAGRSGPLQSAALAPAMAALDAMPEIDQAKVDALRDALAKGEIRFDAGKLAGLIERYHGARA